MQVSIVESKAFWNDSVLSTGVVLLILDTGSSAHGHETMKGDIVAKQPGGRVSMCQYEIGGGHPSLCIVETETYFEVPFLPRVIEARSSTVFKASVYVPFSASMSGIEERLLLFYG